MNFSNSLIIHGVIFQSRQHILSCAWGFTPTKWYMRMYIRTNAWISMSIENTEEVISKFVIHKIVSYFVKHHIQFLSLTILTLQFYISEIDILNFCSRWKVQIYNRRINAVLHCYYVWLEAYNYSSYRPLVGLRSNIKTSRASCLIRMSNRL